MSETSTPSILCVSCGEPCRSFILINQHPHCIDCYERAEQNLRDPVRYIPQMDARIEALEARIEAMEKKLEEKARRFP